MEKPTELGPETCAQFNIDALSMRLSAISHIHFGRELCLPSDFMFDCSLYASSLPKECMQNLQALFEGHNLVREWMCMVTGKTKTRYVTKATNHKFIEGDKVWLWNTVQCKKNFSQAIVRDDTHAVLKILNDFEILISKSSSSKPKFTANQRRN